MQVNEVPQERKDFKGGEDFKKLVYAVDESGNYTGVASAGWEAENYAMKQAWDVIDEDLEATMLLVKSNKVSPIQYYMQKNLMEIALLSQYVGLWQWQVRRHFKPDVFNRLDQKTLGKYAATFNITIEELTHFGKR